MYCTLQYCTLYQWYVLDCKKIRYSTCKVEIYLNLNLKTQKLKPTTNKKCQGSAKVQFPFET